MARTFSLVSLVAVVPWVALSFACAKNNAEPDARATPSQAPESQQAPR
jgi:hypothetical protein